MHSPVWHDFGLCDDDDDDDAHDGGGLCRRQRDCYILMRKRPIVNKCFSEVVRLSMILGTYRYKTDKKRLILKGKLVVALN